MTKTSTRTRSSRGSTKIELPGAYRDLVSLAEETATRLQASTRQPIKMVYASLEGVGAVEVEFAPLPQIVPEVKATVELIADKNARVRKSQELIALAKIYPQGCSDFVCEVLGISWESANSLMGTPKVEVGLPPNYDYGAIEPGDIVGWVKEGGHGHVAVYLGSKRFADVRGEGEKPRELGRWTDKDRVMKSSRFA